MSNKKSILSGTINNGTKSVVRVLSTVMKNVCIFIRTNFIIAIKINEKLKTAKLVRTNKSYILIRTYLDNFSHGLLILSYN